MATETHTKETTVKESDVGTVKEVTVEEKKTVEVPRKDTTVIVTSK